ncbi:hypothetical protein D3C83_67230 [compost metagenome]
MTRPDQVADLHGDHRQAMVFREEHGEPVRELELLDRDLKAARRRGSGSGLGDCTERGQAEAEEQANITEFDHRSRPSRGSAVASSWCTRSILEQRTPRKLAEKLGTKAALDRA